MTPFLAAFLIALSLIVLSVILACLKRKKVDLCLKILGAGIVLAAAVLIFPLQGEAAWKGVISALLMSLQAGSLNAEFSELFAKGDATGVFAYILLLRLICLLAPAIIGGVILTFFNSAFYKIRYGIASPFNDIYYFSELNKRSFMLAMSVKSAMNNGGGRFMAVFCNNGNEPDESLKSKAWEEGFIIIPAYEYECVKKSGHKRYYFEISDDMDMNLSRGKKVISALAQGGLSGHDVKLFIFSDQAEAEIILNSTDKRGLDVQLINVPVTIAYNLMFHRPLYEALDGSKKLRALVVGAGLIGIEVAKSILWCGQSGEDTPLSLKLIDADAEHISAVFRKECPEITQDRYDITFLSADARTEAFERTLDEHCRDCNYIVVSLGDDELNIKTALYLRAYYLRNSTDFDYEPLIAAVVAGDIKSECVKEMAAINKERSIQKGWDDSQRKTENYNIHTFGAYGDIYSYGFILNSDIEKLSLNAHAVYELAFSGGSVSHERIKRGYSANEINKRSSRANAVHVKYKLHQLGFELINGEQAGDKGDVDALLASLSDEGHIDKLAKTEHERWNALLRSEGYRGIGVEDAKRYSHITNGSHKHIRAKLHPCICEWDELDNVANTFDPKFKEYDRNFIRHLPQLIGAIPDENINLSGVGYTVRRIEGDKQE